MCVYIGGGIMTSGIKRFPVFGLVFMYDIYFHFYILYCNIFIWEYIFMGKSEK